MKYLFFISLLTLSFGVKAQIELTNCQGAFTILDPIDWCSDDAQFNNVAVGPSGYGPAGCWTNATEDVWMEFTAFATAVNIVVDGDGSGNTLGNISAALYTGNCGGTINELNCAEGPDIVNMFETALVIGQTYFIRIAGANAAQGSFQLCIKNFNPPVEPGQDCPTASVLCDKSPFVVQVVTGSGTIPNEANGTCLGQENQTTWFKWTAANNGTLTFVITPLQLGDDLDFALFEIPDINSCTRTLIRCVASSCDSEQALPSGLDLTSTDTEEDFNCEANEDNFVRFIDMVQGQSYALMINNFTSSGLGFNMEWGGTGEFLGPDPEFSILPMDSLACDEEFVVINNSTSPPGIIITDYNWVFGERAVPAGSNLENPGPVVYEKFGQKFIVLEVTTDKGCIVTEVLPLYAEPCCDDLADIGINTLEVNDLICPGVPDGSFTVDGFGGSPEYEFAINQSDNYNEETTFGTLFSGTYQVNIIDIKGCEDSILVDINEPIPVIPDAGPDQETILGFPADLDGSWAPLSSNVDILWTSVPVDDNMSCTDCPNPIVTPPGTTTYYMQITTAEGCVSIDSVTVRVKLERPIYAPNVFSPNNDGTNDFFNIFTNLAAEQTELLRVYDRWGELVYEGENVPLNDDREGWDGMINNQKASQGVYGWYAKIRFIDNVVVEFKGDVAIVR